MRSVIETKRTCCCSFAVCNCGGEKDHSLVLQSQLLSKFHSGRASCREGDGKTQGAPMLADMQLVSVRDTS